MVTMGIINAKVFHGRYIVEKHEFEHQVPFLLFDTSALDLPKSLPLFFAYNNFNLFSVHLCHYGFGQFNNFQSYVKDLLAKANLNIEFDKLFLLTQPKILGGGFNPVSFWMGFNKNNQLAFVLAEVNNTFGERHVYVCNEPNGSPIESGSWIKRNKQFHVSPFFEVGGEYAFRFDIADKQIDITINYYNKEKLNLVTSLKGEVVPLTSLKILFVLLKNPLQTFKVSFLIHYHALRLWLKKVPFFSKPLKPKEQITRDNNG